MLEQRLISINLLIKSCIRNGELKQGLQQFQQVFQEGLVPDKITFLSILSASDKKATLTGAKWMHAYIIASRHESDVMVGTSLIHMYGKHHCIEYASSVFKTMSEKNVITWNAMITALVHNRKDEAVLLLFAQMESEGILPVRITYVLIVNACTFMQDLAQGMCMHARIIAAGYASDVVVQSSLLTFYGKCGSICSAETVFSRMSVPNVVAWTALITVYAEHGNSEEAFRSCYEMQAQGVVPNEVTLISLVNVCARQTALKMGFYLHALILLFGYDATVVISNVLIHLYGKCGHTEVCWTIFEGMQEKDLVTWNLMISACTYSGQGSEAMMLFLRLCESGVMPSKATFIAMIDTCATVGLLSAAYALHFQVLGASIKFDSQLSNALISLYGSCGSLRDAQIIFDGTTKSSIVAWNVLLGAHVHCEKGVDALSLFRQMLVEGILPNNVTMITLFSACACHMGLLNEGRHLHACWVVGRGDVMEIAVYNALLNMYNKCDHSWEVWRTFLWMLEHSTISYNVLMLVYVDHNNTKVLQLFNEMLLESLLPSEESFVSILNACANEASLYEANRMHVRILSQRKYSDNPVLQNALIDVYGRCNSPGDAWKVFDELLEQDVVAWNTLIAVCTESSSGLSLFNCMLHQGIMPDEVTYISLITWCASQSTLYSSSCVHARIAGDYQAVSNVVLGTALVKMHGSCGQVRSAWIVFKAMPKRNLISWNTMLTVYARHGEGTNTLKLLRQMHLEAVTPDKITFVAILSACGHEGLAAEATNLLSVIESNYVSERIEDHYKCIVDGLGRAGQLDGAEFLLKSMSIEVLTAPVMAFLSNCKIHGDIGRWRRIYKWILEQEPNAAATHGKTGSSLTPSEIL